MWSSLSDHIQLTFNITTWAEPQCVFFQTQPVETFSEQLCWGVYSNTHPENPTPCVFPMYYYYGRSSQEFEQYNVCTTEYNMDLWHNFGMYIF